MFSLFICGGGAGDFDGLSIGLNIDVLLLCFYVELYFVG
jgi:hypothetical protein